MKCSDEKQSGRTESIRSMANMLSHRGPDDEGYFEDEYISFGFRRLSIIDIAGGHQPVHNEEKTVWCMFNGEIYNFVELTENLKNRDIIFIPEVTRKQSFTPMSNMGWIL